MFSQYATFLRRVADHLRTELDRFGQRILILGLDERLVHSVQHAERTGLPRKALFGQVAARDVVRDARRADENAVPVTKRRHAD